MELAAIFGTSLVVGLTGAMTPGPLLTVTITEAARRGFWVGPLLMVGHAVLEGALVLALAAGLAAAIAHDVVMGAIATIGGVFLLYMGWTIVRDALSGRLRLEVEREAAAAKDGKPAQDPSSNRRLVGLGVLISVANPYWSLWWATIGLGYITLSLNQGTMGLVSFYTGHITADFLWYSLVAGVIAGGRRFLTPLLYRGILALCGGFLVFLGGYFIYSGVTRF